MNNNVYFKSIDEAYEAALIGLNNFKNLSKLIDINKIEKAWYSKLEKNGLNKYFNSNFPYSVFTLCALAGRVELNNGDYMYYHELLTRIDTSLQKLLGCKGIEKFSHKLRNPEGLQFHSTCSELLLAEHYIELENSVNFEIPFTIVDSQGQEYNRDIDLLVSNNKGAWLYEVYNPIDSLEDTGFLDMSPELFLQAVRNKVNKKFMPMKAKEYKGIDTNITFSINIHFCNTLITALYTPLKATVPELITGLKHVKSYSKIIKNILLFENDSFKPSNSLKLHGFI